MSGKRTPRVPCCVCNTNNIVSRARSVLNPSILTCYKIFAGDAGDVGPDKFLCSKCYAKVRKVSRVKENGTYKFSSSVGTSAEVQPHPSVSTHSSPSSEVEPHPSVSTHSSPSSEVEPHPSVSTHSSPSSEVETHPSVSTHSSPSSEVEPHPSDSTHSSPSSKVEPHPSESTHSSPSSKVGPHPSDSTHSSPSSEVQPPSTPVSSEVEPKLPETQSTYEGSPISFPINESSEENCDISVAFTSAGSEIQSESQQKHKCHSCNQSQASSTSSNFRVKLDSIAFTQSCCFICRSPNGRGMVPKAAIKQAYTHMEIFIPSTTRCCRHHLTRENRFKPEELERIDAKKTAIDVSSEAFGDWLMTISTEYQTKTSTYISFEDGGVDESSYRMLTSLDKHEFNALYQMSVAGRLNNSSNRTPRDALGMFLMLLRKNMTQDLIAFLFGVSQPVVSATIHSVKDALLAFFVPANLGVHHLTREEALRDHSVKFVNQVFERPSTSLPLIMDGTYFYIEIPGEFDKQSATWSVHKHRNLFKFMLIVFADGYILDADGPWFANGANNDAKILQALLENDDHGYFQDEGDYCVLDRGFRDAVDEVESYGVDVFMPSLMKKDQQRFTTEQSACSRKVTSCRWVVEAVNGRLKNVFKFFGAVIEAGYTGQTIGDFCKIACAILNKFYPPLMKDSPKNNALAHRMLAKSKQKNELQAELEAKEITTRFPSEWNKISSSSLPDFPRLTMDELVVQVSSVYQLRIAKKYIHQNVDDSGWQVLVHKEEPNLLRAKISSRFQSNRVHHVFIKTDPTKTGLEAILGHVCDCKNGLRVVGCCAHVASVLRYLCYERHLTDQPPPRKRRRFDGVKDAKAERERDNLQ